MPRKGENIYKRKDGRWEGRYINSRTSCGKAVYASVYAKTYREVKQKVSMGAASIALPVASVSGKGPTAAILFSVLAEDWLNLMRPQIKESTYIKYYNLLSSYILPVYKDSKPESITPESLESFCNKLLVSGGKHKKGLSSKTVGDILALIKSIVKYSEKRGYSFPGSIKEISVKQKEPKMTVLSRSEQNQLCEYLLTHPSNKNLGILICLFTGLRIGEICALRWEDISFQKNTIYVHSTMQRLQTPEDPVRKTRIIISTPKSSCSVRLIPIPSIITTFLEQYPVNFHGYVLTGSNSRYIEPRIMQTHFKKILKECSLRPVNFHALRHTFATRCVEVGFDVKSLSEILGHANVSITMNRYVHPTMELKQENMQQLSDLFAVRKNVDTVL